MATLSLVLRARREGEKEEAKHEAGHADLQELADEGDVAKLLATEVAAWLVSHCLWCN